MKISAVKVWRVDMKLKEPYTIAYETYDTASNVFCRLETDEGISGYGCAAPDLEVTGETAADVLDAFNTDILPLIQDGDPLHRVRFLEQLKDLIITRPSAIAMLDMALWDLTAKICGLPVYQLLGSFRDRIPTSITIGILSLRQTLEHAREFIKQGFRILKVKGGLDVQADCERMIKIREAVGKNVILRFDANQGYTVEQALAFSRGVKDAGIEMMEQPTPKEHPQWLSQVKKDSDIPVMADESLVNMSDAYLLARHAWVDMVNIKLMKVGGISEALRINAVARAAGQTAMVGCMDESALAIAAGLHVALSQPNVTMADLDGHLDLLDDPFEGAVILKDGVLYPSRKPGLGF